MMQTGSEPVVGTHTVLQDTTLGVFTDIGSHCHIQESSLGDYTYCAGMNQIDYARIGKFCSIATGVRINPGNHPTYTRAAQHHFTYRCSRYGMGEDDQEFFQWRKAQFVDIGNDVWIGHNAVILPGVRIGNGAVIGAGAVVTHDVAPYAITAGVPARILKYRFDEDTIRRIESTCWWDWDHETLKARMGDFRDIGQFIRQYGAGGQP